MEGRNYIRKWQWTTIACLLVCVIVAFLVFLDPNDGNQVLPDKFLPGGNEIFEDSVPHAELPSSGPSRITSDTEPENFPTLEDILARARPPAPLTRGPPEDLPTLKDILARARPPTPLTRGPPEDLPTLKDILAGVRPPVPLTDGPPEHKPAPEWRVWKALYASLDSLLRKSIAPVERLGGLQPFEADAVLQAGQDYLRQLASIEEEARLEIRTRFRPRNAPPLPAGVDPRRVIQLPYGVTLREILEPEGFYERFEARKQTLLDSHREYLAQLIGPTKLELLDNHVKTDIAPSIKVVTKARRLPPEEWPASLRDRAASLRYLESSR